MSDRAAQPCPNSNGSEMSTTMKQSGWMGHWMQPKHKRPRDGNLCLVNEDRREMNQHMLLCNQVTEPSRSVAVTGPKEAAESRSYEAIQKIRTDGSQLKKERSNLLSFPIFNTHTRGGSNSTQVPGIQNGQCSEFNAATIGKVKPHSAYSFGRQLQQIGTATIGCELLPKETTPNLELELRACDVEGGCLPALEPSRGKLQGVPNRYPYGIMYRKEKVIPFASTSKDDISHRSSYHDFNIDTMRRPSSLNDREDIHLNPSMYAETTRHFLITEKIAIGLSNEGKVFRESMLSTKFNGNLGGYLSLSPASGHVRQGLKLQLLDGSTDSEQKNGGSEENQKAEGSRSIGKLNTMGALTDETSVDTRTMEVDPSLENNQTYGLADLRSNKAVLQGQSTMLSQGKSANICLPDMNEVAHSPDGSANEGEQSNSRTQSLDMEGLFSNNDCPANSKSNPSHVVQPRPELGSRWVKRLKMSSSYTNYAAVGTKSSAKDEALSYEKLRKLSSNLFNRSSSLTSSEPPKDPHLRNTSESKKAAENPNLPNSRKDASTASLKEDRNALLSHSWIQRWRHDQTTSSKKQPIPTEPSETPKAGFDHFQKKTFPSIAAMALMGKAMNGFRTCDFTKKGSFIVWNTNNLPSD